MDARGALAARTDALARGRVVREEGLALRDERGERELRVGKDVEVDRLDATGLVRPRADEEALERDLDDLRAGCEELGEVAARLHVEAVLAGDLGIQLVAVERE